MKLYSAWYCAFAQRARMTLLLKEIDFEYIIEFYLGYSHGEGQKDVAQVN